MRITKSLVGAAVVVTLAGGGVALAASMASASTPAPSSPSIGQVGQVGGRPGPGVTVEKGRGGVEIGGVGRTGTRPGPGVVLEHADPAVPAR